MVSDFFLHYSLDCDEIKVAVIEYMPEPFHEKIAAKDYILSNVYHLKSYVQEITPEVDIIVFPEYSLTSTKILRSDLLTR